MTLLKKPVALIILDGFGYSKNYTDSAITPETMPFFFSLLKEYPWTTLLASGPAVGLPDGVPGNSAVGHFTLGAGKVIEQPLTEFSRLIKENKLIDLPIIKNNFMHLAQTGKTLHLVGLISDGGSHSKVEHTQALITLAGHYGIKRVIVHAILDGRDVPQKSAAQFLERIQETLQALPATTVGEIGTLQGRLYAMDRNDNIERLNQAYNTLTQNAPHTTKNYQDALKYYYAQKLYDEIIPPTQLIQDPTIKDGDGLVFVNIRADRGRELYKLLKQNTKLAFLISGIAFDRDSHDQTICHTPHATDTLNDYLSKHNIRIFSIAESEKYAHITYFFNGGRERKSSQETRVIIPSDSPETFIHEPHMKAHEITQTVLKALKNNLADFYLINYANADMIGHTGDLAATKKAVSYLDQQLEKLYNAFIEEHEGTIYITSDHGNAEDKSNHNPAHTTNPVYFAVVSEPHCPPTLLNGISTLADVKDIIIQNSFNAD
jgi:2,3-bisphosphoglycerate-independent phosphoglycerate mutase